MSQSRGSYNINELLKRSAELEDVLTKYLALDIYGSTDRLRCSKIMCSVSFEHAESIKILIASGNFTSAIGLMRLQYESMVRAMWLLYAASDLLVSKLMSELTQESARKANKLPLLSEMIKTLDGKAPNEAMGMILEFKEYSWKPLSSYIHGGIHAIHRHSKGYPLPLLSQLLKASNGVSVMVGMLLVILSGDSTQSGNMRKIQKEYLDCCPEFKQIDS
jgi:hypothetical protein